MGGNGNPQGIVHLFNVEDFTHEKDSSLVKFDFNFALVSNNCVNYCDDQVVALVTET